MSKPVLYTTKRELAAKLDLLGEAAVAWAAKGGIVWTSALLDAARDYADARAKGLRGAGGDETPSESSPCPICGAPAWDPCPHDSRTP